MHNNNGWISIEEKLPKNGEEVYVLLERQSSYGCRYDVTARFSYFNNGLHPYFTEENSAWKVNYWRRKPELPQKIIDRYVEDCEKNKIAPNLPIRY